MSLVFANDAVSTLGGSISSSDTQLTVASGDGSLFPSPTSGDYFKLTLRSGVYVEIVHCTSRSGDVIDIIRGQEGTGQLSWNEGTRIANTLTSGSMDELIADFSIAVTSTETNKTEAAASASAASTSEDNADASETKAQEWAEKAEDQEVETSQYSALHHAAKASQSASAASTSEDNAAGSASAAAASEADAEAALADFDSVYLRALASDPTVDRNGDPVTEGDLYWSTTTNKLRIYNGDTSAWEDAGSSTTNTGEVALTEGQTEVTIPGGYTVGYLLLFLDGSQLLNEEFTATDGSTVTLTTGAIGGQTLKYLAFGTFDVADTYTRAEADSAFAARVGSYTFVQEDLVGAEIPDKDRYIKLEAGLTGTGEYNEGKLTSESVSGSAPLIDATAIIDDAESPMNGQTVQLVMTSGRAILPGTPGTVADDQMQRITGSFEANQFHTGAGEAATGAFTGFTSAGRAGASGGGGSVTDQGVAFDSANSPNARTGDHTHIRRLESAVYMRIK